MKNDRRAGFNFGLIALIAILGLLVLIWLTFENNALKEKLRIQGDQVEALEKDLAGQGQLLDERNRETLKIRNELDSLKRLFVTTPR